MKKRIFQLVGSPDRIINGVLFRNGFAEVTDPRKASTLRSCIFAKEGMVIEITDEYNAAQEKAAAEKAAIIEKEKQKEKKKEEVITEPTYNELKEMAKAKGIEGYSRMKKQDLIDALEAAEPAKGPVKDEKPTPEALTEEQIRAKLPSDIDKLKEICAANDIDIESLPEGVDAEIIQGIIVESYKNTGELKGIE